MSFSKHFLSGLVVSIGLLFVSLSPASATTCSGGTPANTCYWIGGTGTWDNSSTSHWSFTTGGSTCTCLPSATTDLIVFDGSSGGGTVTFDSTISGSTFTSMTAGAFTGTLDNSVNNANLTFSTQISLTGAGTKTFKMGSATYTLTNGAATNIWDCSTCTNLTLTAGTSIIRVANSGAITGTRSIIFGTKTIATLTLAATTITGSNNSLISISGNSATIGTFNITGPNAVNFTNAANLTVTNALAWTQAGPAAPIVLTGGNGSASTITDAAGGTMSWAVLGGLTFATGTFAATNSMQIGPLTNITVTNPSQSSGHIIGG